MSDKKYYSLDAIKKKKDLEGKEPSIYLICSNRSAGKTTAVLKESLENFKKNKKQTVLIYRYKYELSSANLIYTGVLNMYKEYGEEMTTQSCAEGLFYTLLLDGEPFGYAISMSNIDSLKKYSPLFGLVNMAIFDEFMKEDDKYLSNETEKLQSILVTISRGGGYQARDIKLYMLGNMVSILNPYFITFGIHKRLKSDTHFMRGIGWVAEFGFNKSAQDEIQGTGFYRAFQKESYMEYMTENRYLNDNYSFIGKPKGKSKYFATIKHNNKFYGVYEFYELNILFISTKVDKSCRNVITLNANEHSANTLMLSRSSYTIQVISECFKQGAILFEDLECKNAIFDILALDKIRH